MWRFLLISAFLVTVTVFPDSAYADSFVSDPGAPTKGVVGHHGIRCIGEASAEGHSLRYVIYVGADEDEAPTGGSISAREKSWQESYCFAKIQEEMPRWAAHAYNGEYCLLWNPSARIPGVGEPKDLYCYTKPSLSLSPGDIRITIQRL